MISRYQFASVAATVVVFLTCGAFAMAEDGWVQFEGGDGLGAGKKIVLVSGDEEYRSEEAMPMLAQILSVHHGFDCTVVFSMSPDGKFVDPNNGDSLEGIEALKFADLMIIATRFRHPSEHAMNYIDEYLSKGKPVIGLRTATHGFNGIKGKYSHYNNGYKGDKAKWADGFGRFVLGEKWISHHGHHKHQATGGIIVESAKDHPILRGVDEKTIWGPSDVYGVRLPLPGDSQPLVLGAVLEGMEVGDKPIAGEDDPKKKNDPMMPVVWTKTYDSDSGVKGRVLNTTMGAATDFVEPGLRRIVVNGVFWALGMESQIPLESKIDFVTDYKPSAYGFTPNDGKYWKEKNIKPSDFALETSASH